MKSKIGIKLIITVGLVTVITFGLFSYFIVNSQSDELIAQIERGGYQLSDTIKNSTKYDMMINHTDRIHNIIDMISKQEGIVKLRIFNKEGRVIYAANKSDIGSMVDKHAEACYACHAADQPIEKLPMTDRTRIFEGESGYRNLGIINPIYNEPSCWESSCHAHDKDQKVLGVLDITMSLQTVDHQIKLNRINTLIFSIFAILAVSILLGVSVQHLVGKPVRELVDATNIIAQGDLSHKIEVRGKDELANLALAFNDMIEKLTLAQRQLYQQDKLASLGRLAAGVAHEINNPLTGVLTYSSFLLKRTENDPDAKNDLEVIVRETKRCREIVKGLLDFARQLPSRKTKNNIHDIINRALEIVHNQLAFNKIQVIKNYQDNLPEVSADGNQLQQIFINFIMNASDAIGSDGGNISITTQYNDSKNDSINILISDSGCGIPKENLTKIFDPFYSTKGQKGTGLGLAVVWGIIEKHQGKIDVESEPGKGTTFKITLPVNQSEDSTPLIKG